MIADDGLTDNEATTSPDDSTEAKPQPWPKDDEAVAQWVKKLQKKAETRLSEWYDEAKTAYRFYENKQWEDEDEKIMEGEDRIPVTFNRVKPIVNAICGQEVSNRQEVRYLPRRIGPACNTDPMNDAVKWVREQCNAEDEDSDAFKDMVISGMGWTCGDMDYEVRPDGMPEIERRDPFLMRWDWTARRKNLADAKWIQADYWMAKEAIEDRWPDADIDVQANVQAPLDRPEPHDATQAWKYNNDAAGQDRYNDEYRVVHHVQRFTVNKYRMVDPATQQIQDFDDAQYEKLQANAKKAGVTLPKCAKVSQRVYWHAWVVGKTVLESGQAPAQKEFPYQAMTCYRERETGYWFGIVQPMLDPQRYANLFMSQAMAILSTGAKGGFLYETGAFVNPKKAKSDWAKFNSAIELTEGALQKGKVQRKEPIQLPPDLANLMQFAITSIRDVTGVNVDMLGGAERDQPGIVEDMRTKAGLTILASVFDALRLYRKRQGVLLAEYVTEFISDGRLIRILGPEGEQFIPLIRNPEALEYDLVVDESPTSRDVKEKTWEALQIMVPLAHEQGIPMPPEIIDYAPIPTSLALKWKQLIAQAKSQPPQPPVEVQVAQMKGQQDQQIAQLKAQNEQQIAQAKAQGDSQIEAVKAQAHQATEAARTQADVAIQQHKVQTDFELQVAKTKMQLELEAFRHSAEQQTQIQIANIKAAAEIESARVKAAQASGQAVMEMDMAKAGQAVTEGNSNQMTQIAQGVQQLHEHMKNLHDHLAAPTEFIRGPDGRVSGAVKRLAKGH